MKIIQHFVSIDDLTESDLTAILNLIPRAKRYFNYKKPARDYILANLFFEPSTRTRLSFESAMKRLGGETIGFSDGSNSSVSKGESRTDTALTVGNYCDIMVVRDSIPFTPMEMAEVSSVPIINAGDGTNEHPTQTLTDLVTIYERFGRLNNLTIGLCGDLKHGRTVHSLVKCLSKYPNNKFVFIAPPELQMPNLEVGTPLLHTSTWGIRDNLEKEINNLDILYMTRIQRERFKSMEEYEKVKGVYRLTRDIMQLAKEDMIVMHPLPRVNEIATEVDKDPRAWYFKQVKCGLYARMALIYHMLCL